MVDETDENIHFSAALKDLIGQHERGFQKSLAIDTHITDGYLSQLKNGKRQASAKTQIKIAKALGYKHIEFLSLGRDLLTSQGKRYPQAIPADHPPTVREAETWENKYWTCLEKLEESREHVITLQKQVANLTAPPIGADASVASSGKEGT